MVRELESLFSRFESGSLNRREFIAGEIAALEAAITERETDIATLTDRRANYLSALAGQGALEELTQLQELHAATRLKVDELTNRITQLRQMTTKADTIKVETVELKRATTLDYEERRALWSQALSLFSEFSESLYKSPGRLVIDIDDTGFQGKFDFLRGDINHQLNLINLSLTQPAISGASARRRFVPVPHPPRSTPGTDPPWLFL